MLEVGSGWGRTKVPGRIGIDICESAVKKDRSGIGRIVLGNLLTIPFKDNSFGLSYSAWVLMHIHPKDIRRVVSEIKRVTRSHIVLIELYSEKPTKIDPAKVARISRKSYCFTHSYEELFGWRVVERHILLGVKGKEQILLVLKSG